MGPRSTWPYRQGSAAETIHKVLGVFSRVGMACAPANAVLCRPRGTCACPKNAAEEEQSNLRATKAIPESRDHVSPCTECKSRGGAMMPAALAVGRPWRDRPWWKGTTRGCSSGPRRGAWDLVFPPKPPWQHWLGPCLPVLRKGPCRCRRVRLTGDCSAGCAFGRFGSLLCCRGHRPKAWWRVRRSRSRQRDDCGVVRVDLSLKVGSHSVHCRPGNTGHRHGPNDHRRRRRSRLAMLATVRVENRVPILQHARCEGGGVDSAAMVLGLFPTAVLLGNPFLGKHRLTRLLVCWTRC